MKRYLALRRITTRRCFSTTTPHPRDKHEGHTDFRAPKLKDGDDLSRSDTNWLSDGMEFGLDETTNVSQDIESALSVEYSDSTDPFAVFDAPASTPTNAADFMKELELFDKGARLPVKNECPVSRPGRDGRFGDGGEGSTQPEGEPKRRKKAVPVHLDEKYRFLTRRDKEVFEKEAPLIEAMREKARRMQREWAAKQPPPPSPKASQPSAPPTSEIPPILESSYTPPTSLPTPRQLERLPQSPLLKPTPSFWSEKAYKPKPPASEEPTPFQRKLHRNLYALTLASPVRRCLVTKARLPRDFLTSFELMTNPADGRSWYLPRDLTMPVPKKKLRVPVKTPKAEVSPLANVAADLNDSAQNSAEKDVEYEQGTNHRPRLGPRYYVLSSQHLLSHLTSKRPSNPLSPLSNKGLNNPNQKPPRNPYFGAWQIMNHLAKKPGQAARDGGWRENMDGFVLELMRKRTRELIWKSLYAHEKYVRYVPTWAEIVKQKQMDCVLWLGREELLQSPRDDSEESKAEVAEAVRKETEWGPGPYTTISNEPFWSQKLPVLNALRLLGAEGVKEIRSRGPPVDVKRYVVIKNKPDTVELRRWLWKIENYLAKFEDREEENLGKWEPADDADDAGEDVEFETVWVPEDKR